MPVDLKITAKEYFFTKERHRSRKIHSAEACLTQVEAVPPDDPGNLFSAALVLS